MRSTTLGFLVASLATIATARYQIGGIDFQDGQPIPARRNINDLQKEAGPQWDLYIQALSNLQSRNSDTETSYFQIAGIHGLPFIEWDNAGARRGNGWLGYCPHGENIFLSWHRPYILLFEQELVYEAQSIAAQYPDSVRDKYVDAANNLRAPYWDWALDSAVPQSTVPRTMTINVANNGAVQQQSVRNPLSDYTYPSAAVQGRYGQFDNARGTSRCSRNGESYPASANANLHSRNLKSNLYANFVYSTTYDQFANNANRGVGLENMHNWVHYDGGCGEQFFDISTSGFDPLFMLHHANVDRLWAYWQFMREGDEAIFSGSYYGASRWDTPQGTTISTSSRLSPWINWDNNDHTTESVQSIRDFGYTYDSLSYWNTTSADLATIAKNTINKLYGNGSNQLGGNQPPSNNGGNPPPSNKPPANGGNPPPSNNGNPPPSNNGDNPPPSNNGAPPGWPAGWPWNGNGATATAGNGQASANAGNGASAWASAWAKKRANSDSSPGVTFSTSAPGHENQYFCRIELDRSEVERPCSVDLYLDGKKAGGLVLMAHPAQGKAVSGLVIDDHIQQAINSYGAKDLSNIADRLKIKITKPDGSVIDASKVKSLNVTLEQSRVQLAKNADELPKPAGVAAYNVYSSSFASASASASSGSSGAWACASAGSVSTCSGQNGGYPGTGNNGYPGTGNNGYPGTGNNGYPGTGNNGYPGTGNNGYPGTGNNGYPGTGNNGYPGTGNNGYPGTGYPGTGNNGYPGTGNNGYPGTGNNGYPGYGNNGYGQPGKGYGQPGKGYGY